jgi:hypothetical protein
LRRFWRRELKEELYLLMRDISVLYAEINRMPMEGGD